MEPHCSHPCVYFRSLDNPFSFSLTTATARKSSTARGDSTALITSSPTCRSEGPSLFHLPNPASSSGRATGASRCSSVLFVVLLNYSQKGSLPIWIFLFWHPQVRPLSDGGISWNFTALKDKGNPTRVLHGAPNATPKPSFQRAAIAFVSVCRVQVSHHNASVFVARRGLHWNLNEYNWLTR